MLTADDGWSTGPGSAVLTVPPEHMRAASNELHELANLLQRGALRKLMGTRVEPAGADAVSVMAAQWNNDQIDSGPGSGLHVTRGAIENLRASAEAMARGAAQYEAQEAAIAAGFRTDSAV